MENQNKNYKMTSRVKLDKTESPEECNSTLGLCVSRLSCTADNNVRSESRCALRLRYVELVVSIEEAVEVCCCFTVFSS
jgi:hypothetical protein